MIRLIVAFALVAFGLTLTQATPARAEDAACYPREAVLAQIQGQYRESPAAMALANNGGVIEVLRSPDNATFTIIITMPNGISCMIAAGENWEDLPKTLVKGKRI